MKFNLQSKHAITKNGWGQSSGNNFSCDYPRHVFVKEKEFYSVNGAYVLTNDEDATKCFYSVNKTTFAVCARSKTTIWFKDLAEELEKRNGVGGIVSRKK